MVRAGQVWRAPANSAGRYRYVRVDQVRAIGGYCNCHEVTAEGKAVGGRDGNGIKRRDSIRVAITGGTLSGYTLKED